MRHMEIAAWMGSPYSTHTKFHEDWFEHSKVDKEGHTDTQTEWRSHKLTLGNQVKNTVAMLLFEHRPPNQV
jgi:hypothetical protein